MREMDQQINQIIEQMSVAKEYANIVVTSLDKGKVPTGSQCKKLSENLEQLLLLQNKINQNLKEVELSALSDTQTIDHVKIEVQKYYQSLDELNQTKTEMLRAINTFYLISSESEKFNAAIEEEKINLRKIEESLGNVEKNSHSLFQVLASIKPYNSFVKGVSQGTGALEEDEDDSMSSVISDVAMKGLYLSRYSITETSREVVIEDIKSSGESIAILETPVSTKIDSENIALNKENQKQSSEILENDLGLEEMNEEESFVEEALNNKSIERVDAENQIDDQKNLPIGHEEIEKISSSKQNERIEINVPSINKFSVKVFKSEIAKIPALLLRLSFLTMIPLISENQFHEFTELLLSEEEKKRVFLPQGAFSKEADKGYFVRVKEKDGEEEYYGLANKGWIATQKSTVKKYFGATSFKTKTIAVPDWDNYSDEDFLRSIHLTDGYLSFLKYIESLDRFDLHSNTENFVSNQDLYTVSIPKFSEIENKIIFTYFESENDQVYGDKLLDFISTLEDPNFTIVITTKDPSTLHKIAETLPEKYDKALFDPCNHHLELLKSMTNEDDNQEEQIEVNQSTSESPIIEENPVDLDHLEELTTDKKEESEEEEGVQHRVNNTNNSYELAKSLLNEEKFMMTSDLPRQMTDSLLAENRLPLALVWAKSISKIDSSFKDDYKKLLLATNLDLDERQYSSTVIGNLFPEALSQDDASYNADYLLNLSVLMRALFRPNTAHDYTLLSYAEQIVKSKQVFFEDNPNVKYVLGTLRDFLDSEPMGFTEKTFTYIRDVSQKEKSIHDLQNNAQQLRSESLSSNIRMIQVKHMLKECLGSESEIDEALSIIEKNDKDHYDEVKNLFDAFAVIKDGQIEIDQDLVDGYIDDKWMEVAPSKFKRSRFEYDGRKKLDKKIRDRIHLLGLWLELKSEEVLLASVSQEKKMTIRRHLDDTIRYGRKAISDLEQQDLGENTSGKTVLIQTLENICANLENLVLDSPWIFKEFLLTNYIEVDTKKRPVINHIFDATVGYEPWRRVLKHIVAEPMDFKARFDTIIHDPSEMNRDDFGIASLIQQYLKETGDTSEIIALDLQSACKSAEASLNNHIDLFKSDFEMAYMHGSIDEQEKEDIIQLSGDYKDMLLENNNYGFYMRFLSALTDNIKVLATNRTASLRIEYDEVSMGKSYEDFPIRHNIERLLEDGNIGLASEYIDYLRHGTTSADEEINSILPYDYHMEFLEEYDNIYNRCMTFKGNSLRNQVDREMRLLRNEHKDYTSRILDSAETLIKSWPKHLKETNLPAIIQNYFKELGFTVRDCKDSSAKTIAKSQNWQILDLIVDAPDKNLDYYTHPISKYGTQSKNYSVICMFGGINANEMIQTLSKLDGGIGNNTIILLDNALTKPERRKIAEIYKSKSGWQNSFLVIDQILTLFLASKRPEDRMEALLKCTLPYTYYQPYNNGGGFIADEMFFGRKKELATILDSNGSCLVYGGRQLGKTALLLRAKSIANKPKNKEYTIFINAQKKSSEELLKEVCKELLAIKLIDKEKTTWEELSDVLREKYDQKHYHKLLLLIDEVDDFLSSISKEGYLVLKVLHDLRRETSNNFKFVLAGLHNVTRLSRAKEENSIIPQLGAPLSIQPFSPTDAASLLKIPLSYLGYSFDQESLVSMILLKTNYYPGLLHYFCYTLILTVSEKYKKYYSSEHNPPYILDNEKLKSILFEKEMNNKIKEMFFLTLLLDKRYLKIAYVMAYLFMEKFEEVANGGRGYSAYEIKKTSDDYEVPLLVGIPDDEYLNLLLELSELGVLSNFKNHEGTTLFKFRKYDFSKMFGTEDEIFKHFE